MGPLNRQLFIGLLLALPVLGLSQPDSAGYQRPAGLWLQGNGPWPASGQKNQVELYSALLAGSNHVTAGLLNRFLISEFIDESLKDEAYAKLGKNNTLLVDWRNGARWQFNRKKDGQYAGSWWVGIENRLDITGQFNSDVYALAMYGNARFEGEELMLKAGPIYSYGSNRINVGYQQVSNREELVNTLTGGLSLIQAYDYVGVTDFSGRVYTAEQGTFVEVEAAGKWQASDTSQYGLTRFEGMGTAVQLGFESYNRTSGWRWGVQAGSGDLIRFNKKAFSMSGNFEDTLRGINLTEQTLSELSVPTDIEAISNLFNLKEEAGPYLPLRVWGSAYTTYSLSTSATLSLQYSYLSGIDRQLVQIHWDRQVPNRWLAYGASAYYDNMRGYNLGIRGIAQAGDLSFVLATEDVLGWVLPGTFTGVSYQARLGYRF